MVFCVVNTSIFFFPFYLLCLFFLLLHNGESIGSQFCSFGTDGIGNIGTNLSHSVILRNLLLQQFHFQNRHIYNCFLQLIVLARRECEVFAIDFYRHFSHCPFRGIEVNKRVVVFHKTRQTPLPVCRAKALNQVQHLIR